jgi:hypothetical protein
MTETADVTIHFEGTAAMSDAELALFSKTLQDKAAALADVEAAKSEPVLSKLVGVDDVILVLTVGAKLLGEGAAALTALHHLIAAAKLVAQDMGWSGTVTVEADGGRVKPEELTEDDAAFIKATAGG